MTILGIETSCDETGVAVVKKHKNGTIEIISNVVATSLSLHATTGGIIPEDAAREQLKYILPVLQKSCRKLKDPQKEIDAIAVTVGPGLIGSLLIGVETAKTLSVIWNKPIIPVNHLFGHIYANWLDAESKELKGKPSALRSTPSAISFPALALVVSGNHTDLVLLRSHSTLRVLGSTRDDAAGEAFDKIGRLLGLSYPAGHMISKLAEKGNPNRYNFPRPLKYSGDYDFSFSGLKTAVLREVRSIHTLDTQIISDICASTQQAIIDVLVYKTLLAAEKYKVTSVILGGGVASNTLLKTTMNDSLHATLPNTHFFVPTPQLCTDNGAMIAAAAFFRNKKEPITHITVDPDLYY